MQKIFLTHASPGGIGANEADPLQVDRHNVENADLISSLYDVTEAPESWCRFLKAILQSTGGCLAVVATRSNSLKSDRLWGLQTAGVSDTPSSNPVQPPPSSSTKRDKEATATILPASTLHAMAMLNVPCIKETLIEQSCLIFDLDVRRVVIGLCDKDEDTMSYIVVGLQPNQLWASPDHAALERLLPHISKIIRLQLLIEKMSASAITANTVLNRLPIGVVTFSVTSSIPTVNNVASQIIKATPILLRHLQALALPRMKPSKPMDRKPEPVQLIELPQPLNELYQCVIMSEMRTDQYSITAIVFFIVSANQHISIDAKILQQLFQLTSAEARIANLLVDGHHVDEIGETLAISLSTVRTHLRHIFEKTGVERQADLIHLLLRASLAISSFK